MLYMRNKINHEQRIKQVAVAAIGGALVTGYMGQQAAGSAADQAAAAQAAQAGSAQQAAAVSAKAQADAAAQQQQNYQQQLALQQPFMQAGQAALSNITGGLQPGGAYNQQFDASKMQNMPGIQFQMQQGAQATGQSAAARGMNLSGAAMEALQTNQQGIANQNYQQQYTNFMGAQQQQLGNQQAIANMGQAATNQAGSALSATGVNQANLIAGQGATTAGGINAAAAAQANAANTRASGQLAGQGMLNTAITGAGQYAMSKAYGANNPTDPNQTANPNLPTAPAMDPNAYQSPAPSSVPAFMNQNQQPPQ